MQKKTRKIKRDAITKEIFKEIYQDIIQNKKIRKYQKERNSLIILLLYLFGLRINELKEFTYEHWKDLEEKSKTMIYQPKTQSNRELVMTKRDHKWIKELNPKIPAIWKKGKIGLLVNTKGKSLNNRHTIQLINKILKPYGEKYKKNIKSHSFRIGYVTQMFREKIQTAVIQDIIGHKNILTTLRYNRNITSSEDKIKALNFIKR